MNDIDQRVARLERGNRRLRLIVYGTLAALGLALLSGQATPKDIPTLLRAHQFQLVDREGKTRAILGASADGAPFLNLLDERGEVRASLFVAGDARPALSLRDREGQGRATVGLEPGDAPFVALSDKNGKQTWSAP